MRALQYSVLSLLRQRLPTSHPFPGSTRPRQLQGSPIQLSRSSNLHPPAQHPLLLLQWPFLLKFRPRRATLPPLPPHPSRHPNPTQLGLRVSPQKPYSLDRTSRRLVWERMSARSWTLKGWRRSSPACQDREGAERVFNRRAIGRLPAPSGRRSPPPFSFPPSPNRLPRRVSSVRRRLPPPSPPQSLSGPPPLAGRQASRPCLHPTSSSHPLTTSSNTLRDRHLLRRPLGKVWRRRRSPPWARCSEARKRLEA